MKHFISISALSLLLAACNTVGPDYSAPNSANLPENFKGTVLNPLPSVAPTEKWWTVFNDAGLNKAIEDAHTNSPTLQTAAAKLAEARARLGAADAERAPNLDTTGSASLRETSEQTLPIPENSVKYRANGDTYRAALGASYEIDLWGRVKRGIESAQAQLDASAADLRGVRLALEADVASAWFSRNELLAERTIVSKTITLRNDSVNILSERSASGLAGELDLQRAKLELATLEAELTVLDRQISKQENALAVLTGHAPSNYTAPQATELLGEPPPIPTGVPVDTLSRRPDIAQAEATLHSRTAEIGRAVAAKYPQISLSGSAGFENGDLIDLLSRPGQFWQIGPQLSFPLFDGGRRKADVEAAKARAEQALATHRQLTIQAIREVEDALVDLRSMHEQDQALKRALTAGQASVDLANSRYQSGYATYLDILDSQRSLLTVQRSLVQNRGARLNSSVSLIRALGGGWGPSQ